MSYKVKKVKELVILYHKNEAQRWMEYVRNCLTEEKPDLQIQTVDIETCLSSITSICSGAAVVCLLLSPAFAEIMSREVMTFKNCFNTQVISVVELFLEEGQFESEICTKYSTRKWARFSIGTDESENKQVAKDIVNIVKETTKTSLHDELSKILKANQNKDSPPAKPKKVAEPSIEKEIAGGTGDTNENAESRSAIETEKSKPQALPVDFIEQGKSPNMPVDSGEQGKSPTQSVEEAKQSKTLTLPQTKTNILKDVCPDCIRKAEERVVLVFRKEISEEQLVQVKIEEKLIDTNRLNPYCYLFHAPAHEIGKPVMYVYINGKKTCKRPLHYMSPADLSYTCPQYLLELLGLPDLKSLDKQLTNMFTSSIPHDETLTHIFTPKNLITVTGQKKTSDMLPTLLHFACYYGLQQLCMTITDFPGAFHAMEILNIHNKTPIELAREKGFTDIVQFLETFSEMQNYIDDLEDIYERMSGGKALGTDGYMYMRGQQKTLDPYEYGRIPSREEFECDYVEAGVGNNEEDYEIKIKGSGLVEEVDPDDDIEEPKDIAPQRPPRANREDSAVFEEVAQPPERPPKMMDPMFGETVRKAKTSLGSSHLDELRDLQQSYKHGELTLNDIETLYKAWQQRNCNWKATSIKEREDKMQQMKTQHIEVINKATEKKKTGIFSTFKSKKSPVQALDIQHNVPPNNYSSMYTMRTAPSPSNRDSTSSTSSISSTTNPDETAPAGAVSSGSSLFTGSSSSGSRTSHLDSTIEEEGEDGIPIPPPRPDRTLPRKKKLSRLPTPPMPMYSSSAPKVPPRKY